jgi:hypothetical protein
MMDPMIPRFLPFLLFILALGCDSERTAAKEAERLEHAKGYVKGRKDLTPELQNAILKGEITLGMFPDEARAAGGDAGTAIQRDSRWPATATDEEILEAQRFKPDSSRIHITFRNRTQFNTPEPVSFKVHFKDGQATRIERLE